MESLSTISSLFFIYRTERRIARRLLVNTPDLPRFRRLSARASSRARLAVLALLLVSGCVDGSSAFPPFRSLGWFRYVDGADIRNDCGAVPCHRYRFGYNAIW